MSRPVWPKAEMVGKRRARAARRWQERRDVFGEIFKDGLIEMESQLDKVIGRRRGVRWRWAELK
jgi:hypothetical protein